jgi:xylono-1,5-lactonase
MSLKRLKENSKIINLLKKVNSNLYFLDGPKCLLGESPIWLNKRKIVSWIDILKKKIYFFYTTKNKIIKISLKEKPGFIEKYSEETIIVGQVSGLYLYHIDKKRFTLLYKFKKDHFRINDGFYDKKKRIWFNLYDEKKKNLGSLNFYYKGKITRLEDDLETPNGPIIHYKTKNVFFSDTRKKIIYKKNIDNLKKKKKIFFIYNKSNKGSPDGMKVLNNNIWVAFYRGSSIKKINLLGKIKKSIKLPTSLVTNLVFCDKNKKSIFITTAYKDLSKQQLKKEPLAGKLLLYKLRS